MLGWKKEKIFNKWRKKIYWRKRKLVRFTIFGKKTVPDPFSSVFLGPNKPYEEENILCAKEDFLLERVCRSKDFVHTHTFNFLSLLSSFFGREKAKIEKFIFHEWILGKKSDRSSVSWSFFQFCVRDIDTFALFLRSRLQKSLEEGPKNEYFSSHPAARIKPEYWTKMIRKSISQNVA